jgi:hypothetical protein
VRLQVETSLHRQLKDAYAGDGAATEVHFGDYRIDVVSSGQLVEIQHGCLAAIRDKVRCLLPKHRILVVKPIIIRKQLVKQDAKGGRVVARRLSPKKGNVLDLFHDLVYFVRLFPHPNLTLEAPLVDIEEWRYPGHRRRRRRSADQVEDQRLLHIGRVYCFRTAADLSRLAPRGLPEPFHTGQLAESLHVQRWVAQRIAYCFRETGATVEVGRCCNARLYQFNRR